jgi:hypothetical protein
MIVLCQKRLLVLNARLDIVNPFHVRDARTYPRIRKKAKLRNSLSLKIAWTEIGERIGARIVVVLVVPHPSAGRKNGVCAKESCPGGSKVESSDLRALVRRANDIPVRIVTVM